VKFVKKFNFPLLVTGGGGFTKENVARCWSVETWVLLDTELPNEIPDNDYIKYFAPDYSLKSNLAGNMENLNSKTYLSAIKVQVLENLRAIQHAPSVQMHEVPPDFYVPDIDEDELNLNERMDQHTQDRQILREEIRGRYLCFRHCKGHGGCHRAVEDCTAECIDQLLPL